MKKKFPEWWMENRHFFEIASRLFFVPKKIKKVLRELIETIDRYVFDEETVLNRKDKKEVRASMAHLSEMIVFETNV
jgi:hypothetical protein